MRKIITRLTPAKVSLVATRVPLPRESALLLLLQAEMRCNSSQYRMSTLKTTRKMEG